MDSGNLAESARAGLLLRKLRVKARVNQKQLAIALGMSWSYITLFEAGSIVANERVIRRAFEYLADAAPPELARTRLPVPALTSSAPESPLIRAQAVVPIRFGMLCRRARIDLLVDVMDAAKEVDVNAAKLARFEGGQGGLSEDEIQRVIEYLGVTPPQIEDAVKSVVWMTP